MRRSFLMFRADSFVLSAFLPPVTPADREDRLRGIPSKRSGRMRRFARNG